MANAPTFKSDPDSAYALYRKRGYHVEPDLLTHAECDALVALGHDIRRDQADVLDPIPMPHRAHATFLGVMRDSRVVSVIERLVGGKASGIGGEFFFNKPGTRGFTEHQDNQYLGAPPERFVSCWIGLEDIDSQNGGLYFREGTHLLGELPVRERGEKAGPGQNQGARAYECVTPPECAVVPIVVRKGAALFFHSLLVHGSYDNTSDRHRHVLLMTYIRKGEPFRAGRYQKRTEVELYAWGVSA